LSLSRVVPYVRRTGANGRPDDEVKVEIEIAKDGRKGAERGAR
jgi:hypothetical protein